MPDRIMPGPVEQRRGVGVEQRQTAATVHVHTSKIFSACRDKDCIDDLRVYPTVSSQEIINSAFSVRPDAATLICADVSVDEISFNRGYYTVDVTYFYKVTGQTFPGGVPITGLAVFDKRVILYGSEGSVKTFSSRGNLSESITQAAQDPVAVVSAVDPIALNLRICEKPVAETELRSIPEEIIEALGEDVNLSGDGRQLFVTLGQFSIIRLERDAQLALDAESFIPMQECVGSSDDDPCTLFSRVRFPVDEFFPPDSMPSEERYQDLV